MLGNAYQKYQQNSVETASAEELTLMLYNGAVKFIKQSKIFTEQNDIQMAHTTNIKAQNIIQELNITLNMKYEMSQGLRTIYEYILSQLIDANINKSIEELDNIIPLVEELRDTWKEAMIKAKKKIR